MKEKRTNLIGLFHIDDLSTGDIGEWLNQVNIPNRLRHAVITAFKEAQPLCNKYFYMGTMMIKPSTREANFVPYWPKGEYVQEYESESNLSKGIFVVVKHYDELTARASLLGLNVRDMT